MTDQFEPTVMSQTVLGDVSKPAVSAREQLMVFRREHVSEVIELACDQAELDAERRLCEAISAGPIHVAMTFAPHEVRSCDLKYPHTAGPAADAQDADGNRHASSFIRSKLRRNS